MAQQRNTMQEKYQYFEKPSKLQRNHNHKHKKNQLKQYTLLLKWQQASKKQSKYLTKFNFKKTTAFKRKFSCYGYGGKCGNCSGVSFNQGKQFFKEDIVFNDSKLTICWPSKITA